MNTGINISKESELKLLLLDISIVPTGVTTGEYIIKRGGVYLRTRPASTDNHRSLRRVRRANDETVEAIIRYANQDEFWY